MRAELWRTPKHSSPEQSGRGAPPRPLTTLALAALITVGGSLALAQFAPESAALQIPVPGPAPAPLDAAMRKEVADALAQKLADEYAYAEPGRKMAEAIRDKLTAGGYDKITSADEFAVALQADIRAVVNDKHLRVTFGAGAQPMMQGGLRPQGPIVPQPSNPIRRLEILEGNIGYMELNSLPPLPAVKDVIAAAFIYLQNTDALIIDARGNGGGTPPTVAFFMSYLSEGEPYVVNRVQWRQGNRVDETKTTDLGARSYGAKKPVFYLMSHRTFSGGEEFAYDLQAFRRGVLIGETTGGGANPGGLQPLGHGFSVVLPGGYIVHPVTGTNWRALV
jgi:retinol-binding protein 3